MTTTVKPLIGASSKAAQWNTIDWRAIERQVQRLQMRIAKATREQRWGKVKALQWLLMDIRTLIKTNKTTTTEQLIRQLNSKLRGWANYYRHVVSKATFNYVDAQVFRALMAWIKRRHPCKSAHWKKQRYFRRDGLRQWVFFAPTRDKTGAATTLDLFRATSVPIVRHLKIKAKATPYDPTYIAYSTQRAQLRRMGRRTWEGTLAGA